MTRNRRARSHPTETRRSVPAHKPAASRTAPPRPSTESARETPPPPTAKRFWPAKGVGGAGTRRVSKVRRKCRAILFVDRPPRGGALSREFRKIRPVRALEDCSQLRAPANGSGFLPVVARSLNPSADSGPQAGRDGLPEFDFAEVAGQRLRPEKREGVEGLLLGRRGPSPSPPSEVQIL